MDGYGKAGQTSHKLVLILGGKNMNYVEMSKQVLEAVGGLENISFVEHCATRLRIHYRNKKLVDIEAIKGIDKVVGVVDKTGQIQIIIGPSVHEAYNDFLEVSGYKPGAEQNGSIGNDDEEPVKKNAMYWVTKFGNFSAGVFMPIVPALITGGLILAVKNLMVNYLGMGVESGAAQIMLAIFSAGFSMLPVWIGYTMSSKLKMEPIMGAFLGAVLVSSSISGVEGLDFFGIAIPTVTYTSSVLPVVLGVILMYWVDKGLMRVLPETVRYFLKPLCTMIIVVPATLIVLGPIGTELSGAVGTAITWLMDTIGGVAMAFFAAINPYLVMLGLDKAITPIQIQSLAEVGYDPVVIVMNYVSNICVGASALAVATTMKEKGKKGMLGSFGVTALCGVTEPAFYGSLIMRPKVLIGTAIGAVSAGLVAGLFGLKSFVAGGCPGLLTILFFVNPDGSMGNLILALVVAAVGIIVSFVACRIILAKTEPVKK